MHRHYRCPITTRILVFTSNPVGPRLARALHFVHIFNLHSLGLSDHGSPPLHVVHIFKLLGSPRCKQAFWEAIVAVAYHARNGEVDLPARLHVRKKLLAETVIAQPAVARIYVYLHVC